MRCPNWDSGWCYAEETKYVNGCVGHDKCEYIQKQGEARIKIIMQNGNTGEHYKVETIARMISEEVYGHEYSWQSFVKLAMKIVEELKDE